MRRHILALLSAVAAASVAAACTEVGTDPAIAVAVQFDALKLALVYDDTATGPDSSALRGENGQITSLHAYVFNSRGDTIKSAPIVYSLKDTAARVDSSGVVRLKHGSLPVLQAFSTIGSLQSTIATIPVTQRPDLVRRTDTIATTVLPRGLSVGGHPGSASNANFVVLHTPVASADSAQRADSLVRYYIVNFTIDAQPTILSTGAILVDDTGSPSSVDTTDASGIAGRRVQLTRSSTEFGRDSVVVRAHVTYAGHAVAENGSSVVVHFCVADATVTTKCGP